MGARNRQFSLKWMFAVVAYTALAAASISPSLWKQWTIHAERITEEERGVLELCYWSSLVLVPIFWLLVLNDKWKSKGKAGPRRASFRTSFRFAMNYSITAFATPLVFVLLPWQFRRGADYGVLFFLGTFLVVAVIDVLYRFKRSNENGSDSDSNKTLDQSVSSAAVAGSEQDAFERLSSGQEIVPITFEFETTSADLDAAQKALRRFSLAKPWLILWMVSLGSFLAWAGTSGKGELLEWSGTLSLVLPILLVAAMLKAFLSQRKMKATASCIETRMQFDEQGITCQARESQVVTWNETVGFSESEDYFFVFFTTARAGKTNLLGVLFAPKAAAPDGEETRLRNLLKHKLDHKNEERRAAIERSRRQTRWCLVPLILLTAIVVSAVVRLFLRWLAS